MKYYVLSKNEIIHSTTTKSTSNDEKMSAFVKLIYLGANFNSNMRIKCTSMNMVNIYEYRENVWIFWQTKSLLFHILSILTIFILQSTPCHLLYNRNLLTFRLRHSLSIYMSIEVNVGDLRIAKLSRKICNGKYLKYFDRPKDEKKLLTQ